MDFRDQNYSWNNQKSLNHQFSIVGRIIARRPLFFLLIPILMTAVLSTGVFRMEINRDMDWLYTESNGRAARNKRLVERLFPLNTSIYNDIARITSFTDATMLQMTTRDGGSMLLKEVIQEVLTIDNIVRNLEVEWKGRMANYSVLCGKTFGKCSDMGIMEIVTNFQKIRDGKYKIKYPLSIDNLTYYYKEYGSLLGGVELDRNGYVKDIKALFILYWFDFSDHSKRESIDKWEEAVYNHFINKHYKYIDFSFMNRKSSYRSAEALANKILKIIPIVFGTIVLFSALTCMTDEWVTSKPFLGVSACLSAILAIASGFGFGFHLGIEYQDTFPLLMYMILAIEIDDSFVLIASWRQTNLNNSVPKRMEQTFYHTAVSITITSITNILACNIGMVTTSVPAFKMLCAMAVSCSFFAYIYQLTFFGACLAFSGYSDERNAYSIICSNIRKAMLSADRSCSRNKGDIFMLFFRSNVGYLLNYPAVKAIVIAAFLANLGISVWGWMYVKYGVGMGEIFPANTYTSKFIKIKYKYFDHYNLPVHVIIKDTLNYADPKVQSSIESLAKKLESHPHIAESSNRISWLTYYKRSMQNPYTNILYYGYNMSDKRDFVHGLHNVFLRNRNAIQFNFDIAFNENHTEIVASRFLFPMKDINSRDAEVRAIKEFYEITSKSDLPVEIFGLTFHLLEQAWIVKSMAIQIASLSVGLSFLVFLALSQNIKSSLCVAFIVLCVVCELVGYFSLWGVAIDLASLTIFTVSVGFSVNYPAHMAFAFAAEANLDSKAKIKDAIYRVAFPITQGAFSTIFGLFLLLFQDLYVMEATFKVLCLIALLGLFHSLLVVPVILDLAGILQNLVIKDNAGRSDVPLFTNRNEALGNNSELPEL